MFLQVSVCPHQGGMRGFTRGVCVVLLRGCVVLFGGHAWFYLGGVHGFIWGVAWFYLGGMRGFIWGVCVVLFGGMHGFSGGHAWFFRGACMVFPGGVCGFSGGHAWFFQFFGYNEIRSMSGQYASYWNAFLFCVN